LPHGSRDVTTARPAKTSAATVFALVFRLAAPFCALTTILSPAAVVFAALGLILALAGLKMAKKTGVTIRVRARAEPPEHAEAPGDSLQSGRPRRRCTRAPADYREAPRSRTCHRST
jgi:hypothetical protein